MEIVPMLALRDTFDPPVIPPGTAYKVVWVAEQVLDDDPVFQAVRSDVRLQVADFAGCRPDLVTVVEFGPNVLAAKYEQYRNPFTEPFPEFLIGCTALVGYVFRPVCSLCAGDLAAATGVCTGCGHDEMGYYDDEDDYDPAGEEVPAEVFARFMEWAANVRREQLVKLGPAGKEALG